MATTKIWKVDSHLRRVVDYAKNENKTINPDWEKSSYQAMEDVMNCAADDLKTEQKFYVSGINCVPERAREMMMQTKEQYQKTGGILAWHGYQSFAEGEVDASTAHEIGIKLAEELWPDFEVIVATHLNTKCFHNHFVVNSVSFLTGNKFNACKASYRKMREVSDRLCKEHQLSVITEYKGVSKHYAEWLAEHNGETTWRSIIRNDVDIAIKSSMTFQQFVRNLREKGYEVERRGTLLRLRPPGKERFVRFTKLGKNYTEEEIVERILRQQKRVHPPKPEPQITRKVKVKGDFRLSKITWKGLRALYFFYLRKLREAQRQPVGYAPYILREDLRLMDAISEQSKFVFKYKLDTAEQVEALKSSLIKQVQALTVERTQQRNMKRHQGISEKELAQIDTRISELSNRLKVLRKDIKLCDSVIERSLLIQAKNEQLKILKGKEKEKNEPARRSSRTSREHGDKHYH